MGDDGIQTDRMPTKEGAPWVAAWCEMNDWKWSTDGLGKMRDAGKEIVQ